MISKIPEGKVVTYKDIGFKLGFKGYRFIGRLVGENKDFVNVPCHRVVRSDGFVGGYVFGEDKKVELLRKEGVVIFNNRIVHLDKYKYKF